MVLRISVSDANIFTELFIWSASSRVGAITRALVFLFSLWRSILLLVADRVSSIGIAKAAVLPVPV